MRKPYKVCHPAHGTDIDAGVFPCYRTGMSLISARALARTLQDEGKRVEIRKRLGDHAYKIVNLNT